MNKANGKRSSARYDKFVIYEYENGNDAKADFQSDQRTKGRLRYPGDYPALPNMDLLVKKVRAKRAGRDNGRSFDQA